MRDKKIEKTSIIEVDLSKNNVIALSDVHLGYTEEYTDGFFQRLARSILGKKRKFTEKCDKKEFTAFLTDIRNGKESKVFKNGGSCNTLVFCGDILDLWRSDITDVVKKNKEIFDLLEEIDQVKNDFKVYYVVGNHDYWCRNVKGGTFDFDYGFHRKLLALEGKFPDIISFHKNLLLVDEQDSNNDIFFLHGDEFEFAGTLGISTEMVYDALCYSDKRQGKFYDDLWKLIVEGGRWFGRFKFFLKYMFRGFLKRASERTKSLSKVEKKIIKFVKKNEINVLVFGHTHNPFSKNVEKGSVINTGTWVTTTETILKTDESTETKLNTFVTIENGIASLFEYDSDKFGKIFGNK